MWCTTMQRNLQQRMEEHAAILNSATGGQVMRRYNQLMAYITQLGNNILRSWNLLTVLILKDFMGLFFLPFPWDHLFPG